MEGNVTDPQEFMVIRDLRDAGLFLRRNMLLIGLTTVGFTVIAILLGVLLPARYAGEAVIMLDPRTTHVSNVEAVVSSLPPDTSAIRSEIDIIESRAIINRIITDLELMKDPDFAANRSGFREWIDSLRGTPVMDDQAQADLDRTMVAEKLLKNLDVTNDGRSYSITIRYRDRNPIKAAKIANAFADQYLVDQLEVKFGMMQRANAWLAKRMESLRGEVKDAERAVEEFKIKNNLVGAGDETVTQQQLGAMNPQLLDARADRASAEARLRSVKGLAGTRLEAAPAVLASPLIQQLKQQEAEVRRKEADLATRYGNRHPMMINVRNELASIRAKVGEEVQKVIAGLRNDYTIADSKVRSLESDLAKLEGKTGAGNQAMVGLRQLQREAAASRTLYEGFLNRFKQLAEQQDLQMADARIVARAEVPVKPYFPNLLIFTLLGFGLGGMAGFLIAFLIEQLDNGFRAMARLERALDVTGLGIVPLASDAPKGQSPSDYVLTKPLSTYAEAIRSVRMAVQFSNIDAPPKVLMITSSVPNEGKTMFAVSLARLMAKSGLRVLIIDGDMRRPRIHTIMGVDPAKPDLAKVLAGGTTFEKALQKDISGADVLIARSKAPNPQDLLGSRQMESLLASAREKYDMILIDTPPIMAVADAAMVAKLADATIYAVKWAMTPRDVVGEGLKRIRSYNIKLAGVILTQVNLDVQKRYGYGDYGYYYGHYKNYYAS